MSVTYRCDRCGQGWDGAFYQISITALIGPAGPGAFRGGQWDICEPCLEAILPKLKLKPPLPVARQVNA